MTAGAGLALLTVDMVADGAGGWGLCKSQTTLSGVPNRTVFESSDAQWG